MALMISLHQEKKYAFMLCDVVDFININP